MTGINRKAASLQAIVISVLVFAFFVVTLTTITVDTGNNYNVQTDENFSQSLNESTYEINRLSTDMANNVRSAEASTAGTIVDFVTSGVSSLQIIYESLNVITNLGGVVANQMGVPPAALAFFVIVTTLVITFAIVAALLKTGRI